MKQTLVVGKDFAKKRLDVFLAKNDPSTARNFFQNEIKAARVLVNSKATTPGRKLKEGDCISFAKEFKEYQKEKIAATPQDNIHFEILFENQDFAIIDKPANLSVHPSINEKKNTLANGLLCKFPQIKNVGDDPVRPGIVHRLDKETSGLMIVPLNQESFSAFKEMFQSHQIKKKYVALCWGILEQKNGKVESFIGRSKSNPLKQSTSPNINKIFNPKKAITIFKLLKQLNDHCIVELSPKTGRMHQIRIHMHSIGHPLLGDKKYFNKLFKRGNSKFDRHLLHATELDFTFKDKKYHFASALPDEFKKTTHSNRSAVKK